MMRLVLGAAAVSAAFGGLVFGLGETRQPAWSPVATAEVSVVQLGLAVALVFFSALLVMSAARRRRRARASVVGAGRPAEQGSPDATDATDATDVTDPRVLRAQIRALEQALEQETAPVTDVIPGPATAPVTDESLTEALRLVRATVRALGVRMDGDPAALEVLARVDAAVSRLEDPVPFGRPTLVSVSATDVPPAAVAPETSAAPDRTVAKTAAPLVTPTRTVEEAATRAVASDEPEVVLPVPAPVQSPHAQRGRRWLRRGAA